MKKTIFALFAVASMAVATAADYTNGVFVLNEDWYGHNPSSINYYGYADSAFTFNIYKLQNEGLTLGNTTQFAQLYGDNIYFMSKQNWGSSAGRLIVADAKTLVRKCSIEALGADGRSYCGVTPAKGYVGTASGLYVFDQVNLKLGSKIEGTDYEIGDMIRVGNYVYAVAGGAQLLVINPETDNVVKSISISKLSTVFVSNSGNVYANVNSASWGLPSSSATEQFLRIDPKTLEVADTIKVPMAAQNAAFAWKHTAPAVDPEADAIYYSPAESSSIICKYDFKTGEFTKEFATFPSGHIMYGAVVGVDPHNGDLLATTMEGYSSTNYWLEVFDRTTGALKKSVALSKANYWFPSMLFYPDTQMPVINIDDCNIEVNSGAHYNLLTTVTDADNQAALIITTAESADSTVATAEVDGFTLTLKGVASGSTTVKVTACSNGKTVTRDVKVKVGSATGVSDVDANREVASVTYYNVAGVAQTTPFNGVNVVVTRYTDGTISTVKRVVR